MSDNNDIHASEESKPRTKYKKIHIEIAPISWKNISEAVDEYNNNPDRVTPDIKPDHIINDALNRYLSELENELIDEANNE